MSVKTCTDRIRESISTLIYGCTEAKELALCALFSEGHLLISDVPGTGKTELAKSLALSLGLTFHRLQFTPDLLPSDVTGIYYYNQKEAEFVLRRGPVFTNILLADEINRATPRTQAALLECMQEKSATVDGETMALPSPFFVIATMNPVEFAGTFPLPEAQLDRFMMSVKMTYPAEEDEMRIIDRAVEGRRVEELTACVSAEEFEECRREIAAVHISEDVRDYIVRLVRATREEERVRLGVSPRGTGILARAAKTYAAMQGRDYVIPDDIKALAVPVLAHRIVSAAQSSLRMGDSNEDIIRYLLTKVPAPII